ncbi:predicted protein [Paecilomyces variotii No. 5]|uniref:Methyltransferase domain-containing protein n=1 Tax=Byssochlamys spectabilis (strain No. 5 / NBRC 109023) TaxID=1356009 RepID=V5FYU7_BYSSN|nr:predicted protein [Paecilomyces variotii No. 5]
MSSSQDEVYLLRNRNQTETERLNFQHNVLKRIMGNRVAHPQVPLEKIHSVADIATGTAIWLRDLQDFYASAPNSNGEKRYLHGFDISDAQYPSDLKAVTLSIHDVTRPFDQQFHNRFDLVHVRLLVFALTPVQIKTAIANILQIVAPGGYIQWDDLRSGEVGFNVPDTGLEPDINIISDFAASMGFSDQLPSLIKEYFEEFGLQDIVADEHSTLDEPDAAEPARKLYSITIKTLLVEILKRKGLSEDELAQKVQEFNSRTSAAFEKGVIPQALPAIYICDSRQPTSPLVFSAKSSISDTLFHFDAPSNHASEPIFALRITSLQDVTLLGFRCLHYIVDSRAMFDIVKAYSALISGNSIATLVFPWDEKHDPMSKLVPVEETPSQDPTVGLDGYQVGAIPTLLTYFHMLWKWMKGCLGIIEAPEVRCVYVPHDWVNDIRQHAIKELAQDDEARTIAADLTKQDILTAWYLKCSYQNSTPDSRPVSFYYSINWHFTLPPLPYGELCLRHTVYARLIQFNSLQKLQQDSLVQNALTIRQAVIKARTSSEMYRSLKFFESNLTKPVTMGGPGVDLNRTPILSSSTAMPFCELNFRGASTTGSEAKVIYVQPWVPLPMGLQFAPFCLSTKDGKGGYWLRTTNVPQGWKGFPAEVDA